MKSTASETTSGHLIVSDVLEPVPRPEELREEWAELADASGNVFATWEWTECWWRNLGRDRPRLVTACRRPDGELVAILPLYRSAARPFRIIRFLGHGAADQLGGICRPGDEAVAARALRRVLQQTPAWDVFLAENLPGDAGWASMLGGRTLVREGSPVLEIQGRSWEELLASRSRNSRQQVRRRERILARDHALRYRLADDPDRLDDDLATLYRLHRARWGASSSFGPKWNFHLDFARQAFAQGWLRLWLMEVDGEPVAAWYGLRFKGVESYYQAGRNPQWDEYHVGFLLLIHTIREAMNDGMRAYRFLRGGEAYKNRFASHDPGLETVTVAGSLLGRGVAAGAAALFSLPGETWRPLRNVAG